MEQAYKKRLHQATANSPPVLPKDGENYFLNLKKKSSLLNDLYTLYNCKERRKFPTFFIFLLHYILYLR